MTNLGRFTVSTALLSALMALPCVCSAYEAPEQLCHDMAESAYQVAVAMGDGLPDATYERVQANCEYEAYLAHLAADRGTSLNELVEFDQDGQTFFVEAGWL